VQLEHAKGTYLDNPVLLGLLEQRIRAIKAQLNEMERERQRRQKAAA